MEMGSKENVRSHNDDTDSMGYVSRNGSIERETTIINEISESEDKFIKVTPPDGGFGWIVVFASFMCNVIVDGIIFSFGIFLLEISSSFNETRGSTAWIGSLQAGFYLTAGPFVSALANKYGCRNVSIFGSILATIGFVLSFFATSLSFLYVTFGILGGIGFGFIFLPAIVTVGFYFEKRRAFATGIAVCGSGIGTFLMAPLTQYLIESYGWRGSLLILAGITLNCAVFGSLFRPLELNFRPKKSSFTRIEEAKDGLWIEPQDYLEEDKDEAISPTDSQNSAPPLYSEVVDNHINFFSSNNNDSHKPLISLPNTNYELKNENELMKRRTKSVDHHNMNQFYRSDFQPLYYSAISLTADRTIDISKSFQHNSKNIMNRIVSASTLSTLTSSPPSNCFNVSSLIEIFDLSLLSSPSFLLLAISGFLCMMGFFIPFMYLSDRAQILGCSPESSAFLLSIIGITNTFGRVFCGWISDHKKINALLINNIALVIGGTITILSPMLFKTYTSLIVYGAIFGFAIACFAALRSIITVELLGLERLTNAFGFLLLFQGIATIVGSPMAGWFFDMTGSYDYSFYLSGSVITISGIMCFSLPAISKWEKGKPGSGVINE